MAKIYDNFNGYLKVENEIYTYNVSENVVTLLPAESDRSKREEALKSIKMYNTKYPEYLYSEDSCEKIAMLRKGTFRFDVLGMDSAIKFVTPIIVKASGNTQYFFDMLTENGINFMLLHFAAEI